jgi:hypothetical protein
VNCPNCGNEITMRAEHCYQCGARITRDFNILAGAVQDDAAYRRGEQLAGTFRTLLVVLVFAAAVLYALNDYFDKKLTYTPSVLPSIPSTAGGSVELPNLKRPIADPNSVAPVPKSLMTAFGYRSLPFKVELRAANNGEMTGQNAEQRISSALMFLAAQQETGKDLKGAWIPKIAPKAWGDWNTKKWDAGGVIPVTGLATLCFLGEGITWLPDARGAKHLHAPKVEAAIQFLLSKQTPEGHFGTSAEDSQNFVYGHAIATMAVVEAAGLTGDDTLRNAAQKGLDILIKSQNDLGGWDYYGKKDATGGNAYISLWAVLALAEGEEAGLNVPDSALQKARDFYRKLTQRDGRVAYSPPPNDDNQLRLGLCGHAMMARGILNEDSRSGGMVPLATQLRGAMFTTRPEWGGSRWHPDAAKNDDEKRAMIDPLLLFSATYGAFFYGGGEWDAWNDYTKKTLAHFQDTDGGFRMNDPFSRFGGTIYSTALSVLTMQVYYRFPSAIMKTPPPGGAGVKAGE